MKTENARQIVALAQTHGAMMMGTQIPGNLCGPYNSKVRQQVMLLATGQKLPVAKCGVYALEAALQAALNVPQGGCLAHTRDNINSTLRALAGAV